MRFVTTTNSKYFKSNKTRRYSRRKSSTSAFPKKVKVIGSSRPRFPSNNPTFATSYSSYSTGSSNASSYRGFEQEEKSFQVESSARAVRPFYWRKFVEDNIKSLKMVRKDPKPGKLIEDYTTLCIMLNTLLVKKEFVLRYAGQTRVIKFKNEKSDLYLSLKRTILSSRKKVQLTTKHLYPRCKFIKC